MDLFAQARNLGLQTEYIDGQGHRRVTDAAALKIIIDALPPRNPGRFIGQPVVVRSGQPARTGLSQAATLPAAWEIVAGLKVIAKGETSDGTIIWPPDLPPGVHRLRLTDATPPPRTCR
jgi:4-alpha-glucanotransferase